MSANDRPERPRRDQQPAELPAGVEYWQAPHLFLLHNVLTFLNSLRAIGARPRVLLCDLRAVPVLDSRACHAMSVLHWQCRHGRTTLVLGGVGSDVRRALGVLGMLDELGPKNVLPRLRDALARTRVLVERS